MLKRDILESLGTRFLLFGFGAMGSIILTRALGPEGRGFFLAATGLVNLGIQFGTLGLGSSNTYHLSSGRMPGATLAGNAAALSLGFGLVLAVLGLGAGIRINGLLSGLGWPALAAAMATIPFGLALFFGQNLLLAVGDVRYYNVVELVRTLGWNAAIVVFVVALGWGQRGAVWLNLLVFAASAAWVWVRLSRFAMVFAPRWNFGAFRATLGYGLKAYAVTMAGFLVLRLDLLLVQNWRGAVDTGQDGVAVQLGDLVLAIPATIAMVIFPKASELGARAWALVWRTTWMTGAALLALVVAAWILAPWAIPMVFGRPFSAAVPAFRWLLPGIWFLAMETILVQYLNGLGMPVALVWCWAGTLAMNLGLNYLWVPGWGIIGAAIASTLAYGVMAVLVFALTYCHRRGLLPGLR